MPHPSVERLSAYLDGDLAEPLLTQTARHLESCGTCRRRIEELRDLVRAAGALGDREPERDLWPGIAQRLDTGARLPARRWAMVAVALAAAAVVAGVVYFALPGDPRGSSEGRFAEIESRVRAETAAADELEERLASSPAVTAVAAVAGQRLARERQVIDGALEETREALAEDPGNPFLEEHLRRLSRQRVRLLEGVGRAARPATGSTG